MIILENVLTSHLVLFLDDFRQREEGLYFGERNLTFSCHLGGDPAYSKCVVEWGQRLLGMESSVKQTLKQSLELRIWDFAGWK